MGRGRWVLALGVVLALFGETGAQPRASRDEQLAEASGQQLMAERALAIGEYQRGLPFAEAALAAREAVLAPGDPLIADSALVVGVMRAHNGDRRAAEPLLARALAIREKALPTSDPAIAAALVAYAALLREVGAYARAEAMLVRAVAIEERAAKTPGPGLARALEELALVLGEKDDPRSEPMLQRAIAILEASAGTDSVDVARPLGELADLRARRGDAAGAEPLYLRAMAILESTGDLGDPRRAAALLDVARLRLAAGHADEAMTLGGLAYTVDVGILGAEHPFVARDLMRLAELARASGDAMRAERYVWRALGIRERTLGATHPGVADALAELAAAYEARADLGNAVKLLRRALAIYRGALGASHPSVARTLVSLARLAAAQQDLPGAIALAAEAGEIREDSLQLLLDAGSERQKRLYLATLDEETNATIALHAQLAPGDAAALRLAALTVLRRKGRVLDTMVDTFAALRGRVAPADLASIEQLATARSRLAELVLQGPAPGTSAEQHAKDVAALTEEAQRLEADLGARAGVHRERTRVTLEAVQAAIPPGRVLIELASYQPLVLDGGGGAKPPDRRYVAYVLAARGEPRWVDLGPQGPIDALVRQVRAAFADSARTDATPLARQLDARVMQPIRPLLGPDDALVLSPEGALNLVPFGAFVDEDGRFLVERRAITYVTTGRDLVRIAAGDADAAGAGAVVVADPAFGDTAETPTGTGDQRRSSELAGVVFPPLPGTREEGEALAARLDHPTVRVGDDATEAAIKAMRAPALLHVATHGFFLDDMPGGPLGTRALVRVSGDGAAAPPAAAPGVIENPLLRSGLAFAGVNRGGAGAAGTDDGVLTALEAASLDLWGTQLVVLSACETGVGLVRNGDGVYGLRRALVMAGSRSQVISLWKVDDLATRDLMIAYYERITAGEGRGDALRGAQLAMLAQPERRHPFFWASFIPSGDWRPMPPSSRGGVAPVGRGARGCGCGAGDDGAGGAGGACLLALLVVTSMRRGRALAVGLVAVLATTTTVARADTVVTLPASRLELQLPGAPGTWTASDASSGGRAWDLLRRSGPELAIRAQVTRGPTSCFVTLTLRHLASMSGARVVTRPSYLPPEFFPDTLELAGAGGAMALACVDLPDGAATMIIQYRGAAWAKDAALATPVLRAFAAAAAWGPGRVIGAARDVTLPLTKLALRLPGGWAETHAPTFDIVERRHAGKPLVRLGIRTDVVRPRPSPKGAADSCAFWSEGLRIAPTPDVQVIDRPAFVPRAWHAHAAFTAEPRHDRVIVCLDTAAGRWLATVEVLGAITDPGLADVTAILQHIAEHP